MTEELKPLSKRKKKFVLEYVDCFNATEAARRAGYKDNDLLHTNANKLLQDTTIKAEIDAHLMEIQMSADEALKRQAEIGRGDISDFMDISSIGFRLDLAKAKEEGRMHLIKKVKQKVTTFIAKKPNEEDREIVETEIELYPADAAHERILKIHGKMKGDPPAINVNLSWKEFVDANSNSNTNDS